MRYTTELTEPVWFYLRGEEYSAQLDHFVERVRRGAVEGMNTFASAAITDRVIELLNLDATDGCAHERRRLRRTGGGSPAARSVTASTAWSPSPTRRPTGRR